MAHEPEVIDDLMGVIDRHAGRVHNRAGVVADALREVLERYDTTNAQAGYGNGTPDRLAVIMRMQREFQEVILGHGDLAGLEPKARADYFRTQFTGLVVELGEASSEVAWKPWATSDHLNHKAYASEIIDAFHFLLNLAFLVDMSADELYEGYMAKQRKNRQRQIDGYDGVTGKCPGCRRSYDDSGVRCSPTHSGPDGAGKGWCEVYGAMDTPVVEA